MGMPYVAEEHISFHGEGWPVRATFYEQTNTRTAREWRPLMDSNLVNLAIGTAGSLIANAITWTAGKIRSVAATRLFRRATPEERPALLTAVEQALQQPDTNQARTDLADVLGDYLRAHEDAAEDFRSFIREYPDTAGQTTITNQSGTKIGQQGTFNGGTFSNTM